MEEREHLRVCTKILENFKIKSLTKAELCLAIKHGKCVGVFRPYHWQTVENGEFRGRLMFEGENLEDSEYIGKDFSLVFDHLQTPIRYIGNW